MALGRTAKIWLIVLSIPVVLLIAGVITLKILFTSERLKAFLIPQIEEATHRTVTVADISLSVFPSLAVEVDSLAMSNKKGEGFSERPFLTLDRLVLEVKLFSLIKGTLEVPTVVLEHPTVLLEINSDGVTNYSEKENEKGVAKPTGTTGGGAFVLSSFRVVNGVVEYYDRQENSAMVMEGVNQETKVETEPVMSDVRIWSEGVVDKFSYGSLSSRYVSELRVTSKLEMVYKQKDDRLTIEKGEGALQDIAMTIGGSVEHVSTAPTMGIVVESAHAGIPELLSLAPKEYMKKASGLEGKGTARIEITISGLVSDSTKPDVHGIISATNASIRYSSLPKPITDINIVADFTRTMKKQEFHMSKFSANMGQNPLSATMTVVNFESPVLTLAVGASMNLAEVRDYYPLEAGTELSGRLDARANVSGKVSDQRSMRASGSLNFQNVSIKTATSKKPIKNLNGTITFNNQIIEAQKISMSLGKSDLSLGFWLKNYLSLMGDEKQAARPAANLTLTSTHIVLDDLMSDEGTPANQGQKGKGTAKSGGLPLPGVDMDIAATIGTLTMERFELANVRSTMHISEGVVTLQNFSCNTFNGSVITRGTLNLKNPAQPVFDLSMDMNGLNANSILAKFTTFGTRVFGKLTMNTTLKGSLDDTLGLITQSLSGNGRVQIQNGRLTGVKVNQVVASMLNLPNLEQVNFRDWANTFTISNGRMQIKDLKISALDAEYHVDGTMGFDGSLDCAMVVLLSAEASSKIKVSGLAGQAIDLLKDSSGRVRLDFAVTGTSDSPKVTLNTDAARKKAEDLAKKKLEEELKKKTQDLLQGLDPFKKKKPD